jgi:alkylation response protein AidB-like acyl-CoA dehydrogenase
MQSGDSDADVAQQLLGGVRSFARREVPQHLADHPEEEYPETLVHRLRELGVFGADVPTQYGGLGCGEHTTAGEPIYAVTPPTVLGTGGWNTFMYDGYVPIATSHCYYARVWFVDGSTTYGHTESPGACA